MVWYEKNKRYLGAYLEKKKKYLKVINNNRSIDQKHSNPINGCIMHLTLSPEILSQRDRQILKINRSWTHYSGLLHPEMTKWVCRCFTIFSLSPCNHRLVSTLESCQFLKQPITMVITTATNHHDYPLYIQVSQQVLGNPVREKQTAARVTADWQRSALPLRKTTFHLHTPCSGLSLLIIAAVRWNPPWNLPVTLTYEHMYNTIWYANLFRNQTALRARNI